MKYSVNDYKMAIYIMKKCIEKHPEVKVFRKMNEEFKSKLKELTNGEFDFNEETVLF